VNLRHYTLAAVEQEDAAPSAAVDGRPGRGGNGGGSGGVAGGSRSGGGGGGGGGGAELERLRLEVQQLTKALSDREGLLVSLTAQQASTALPSLDNTSLAAADTISTSTLSSTSTSTFTSAAAAAATNADAADAKYRHWLQLHSSSAVNTEEAAGVNDDTTTLAVAYTKCKEGSTSTSISTAAPVVPYDATDSKTEEVTGVVVTSPSSSAAPRGVMPPPSTAPRGMMPPSSAVPTGLVSSSSTLVGPASFASPRVEVTPPPGGVLRPSRASSAGAGAGNDDTKRTHNDQAGGSL